jgi:outer membrane protein assembly factor BamB
MRFSHLVVPRSLLRSRVVGLALLIASLLLASTIGIRFAFSQFRQPRQPIRRNQPAGADGNSGVYLPSDRSLSRSVARARERLAAHEYQEVLAFLQGILSREEDSFLERAGDDRQQQGIKATVRRMIGELPSDGHDAYELLQGANAKRQLESALRSGDRDGLAKIVRQYFHTQAGYDASLVLAQMEGDMGHRLAAAALYRELMETPRAASRFEPQLSIAAAVNLLAAGQTADAAATIRSLAQNKSYAQVTLAGKTVALPGASGDPIGWLTNLVGQPQAARLVDANWLTLHGDPSRNVQATGGRPHLRPRWEARVVNEPSLETFLNGRNDDFVQRGVLVIPGARPIGVGDAVIMRTPKNIVAVDFQSGKRIWESRDEDDPQPEVTNVDATPGIEREPFGNQNKLEERVWDDVLSNSLSSDGKRVFVVRGMSITRDEEPPGWQAQFMGRNGTDNVTATNQLAAYDIATQGKLAWEIDGSRAAGKLAGAFFLGAPVAIDNTLYVMAEIRYAVFLLALDPTTGEVRWQQQLIGLEQGIAPDSSRRQAGVTPSYGGGILVCPTSASTVLGIDVIKREFAWVYRYPREAPSFVERNFWQQQQVQAQLVRANNKWLDSSAVIADGRVLLTPPESSEIHCLDLHTGEQRWKHRQGDYLFLGGVARGNVLLVGAQSVQALRLADASPAWEKETISLPSGVLPAGQGYFSEGSYFLPLTSGQIAEIDMASGKYTEHGSADSNISLGNLICYRGSVVSQSPLVLDKFEQFAALRQRSEAALARNPNDAIGLREQAEIVRANGKSSEAVKLLKRAYELAPEDPVTQEMLVEFLLERMGSDYATYHDDVPLVAKLVHNRDQQIDLMRIDAAGLDQLGQRAAAWDAYLRFADFTAEEPTYLKIEDKYTVRSDRWISARIARLWSGSSPEERKTFAEKLAARRPSLHNPRTAADLRHYLAHLDQLPGAGDVRRALASFLIERGRLQEAEIEILEALASSNEAEQTAAGELMARLSAKPESLRVKQPRPWPHGHVDAEIVPIPVPTAPRDRVVNMPGERPQAVNYRQLKIEQDFYPQAFPMQFFVSADCSDIIGRNTSGYDLFRRAFDSNAVSRQNRDVNFVHGARLGHLLYIALGNQVVAIDSRQDRPNADVDLLWSSQSPDGISRDSARPRHAPGSQRRVDRPPLYHTFGRKRMNGSGSALLASLGPATPRGVVYQDDDGLKCVDPSSGATLWVRTDIPPGCELFGDREMVFAADVGGSDVYVVRLSDGQLLDKRDRPKANWLLTVGRNVARTGSDPNHPNRMMLSVIDVWEQKPLYETELPSGSRLAVVEPNAIAVFDPTGQFRCIDVQSGRSVIDEKLEAASDVQSIFTMRAGDELYLFINGPVQSNNFKSLGQPLPFDFPLINGPVYAFNMKTGKQLWPGPALVRNRGIILSQPADVPFLVFAEKQSTGEGGSGVGGRLRVLCLDKRTGEAAYRNDRIPDNPTNRFRIRAENESRPLVALELGGTKIHLTLTDRPKAPQPPANDDLEVSRETTERGIRGLGARMSGALRDALDKSVPTPGQQPGDAQKSGKGSEGGKEEGQP